MENRSFFILLSVIFISIFGIFFTLTNIQATPLPGTNADLDQYEWFDGSTYTDQTTAANNATSTDFTLGSATTTGNPAAYFRMNNIFNRIKLDIGTPGVGGAVAWEYWNGTTWTPLSVIDNTSNFTASGTVSFIPPADWTKNNIMQEVTMIAGGDLRSALVRKSDGTVWDWGWNGQGGMLGNGNRGVDTNLPVQVSNLSGVTTTTCGGEHSLALKSDGTVWAWGDNDRGELGIGSYGGFSDVAIQVPNFTGATAISQSFFSSMALKSDGTVWAWGNNGSGEVGNDTIIGVAVNIPTQVVNSADPTGYLTGIEAIAQGHGFALALQSDGTVWTWGFNGSGQLGDGTNNTSNVPVHISGLTGVTAIAAGWQYSIALKSDGTVWAWGNNFLGQLGNGGNVSSNVPVQVIDSNDPTGYLTNATAIGGNGQNGHSLVLKSDGTVWAWGASGSNGTSSDTNAPAQISELTNITAIAAGIYHSLALQSDGTVWAWGSNDYGQLGDGTNNYSNVPVRVSTDDVIVQNHHYIRARTVTSYTSVPLGTQVSSEILNLNLKIKVQRESDNGTVTGLTSDAFAISGCTDTTKYDFQEDGGGVYELALAPNQTCNYKVSKTGYAGTAISTGVLTDSLVDQTSVPYILKFGLKVIIKEESGNNITLLNEYSAISGSSAHSLALELDGTVWAWGYNGRGQLGNDNTGVNSAVPVQVLGAGASGYLTDITAVSAGSHSLALQSDGTVWAWGNNNSGQLGNDNTGVDSAVPVQVLNLAEVTKIIAGISNNYSLALKSDGTVWAWGSNGSGQLGNDNTGVDSAVPVQVLGAGASGYLTDIVAISGNDHSLAIKSDGTVWAWGSNGSGQLGNDNDGVDSSVPVQVLGAGASGYLTDITAVSAGSSHSLAIKSDGTVWTWGSNVSGQLGNDNAGVFSAVPVQVLGAGASGYLTDIVAISGNDHSLAIKSDGTVWAWGSNGSGQLGNDNDGVDSAVPVQVLGAGASGYLTDITAVSAGAGYSLALKSDGTVWAWGSNGSGQLGNDNVGVNSAVPVQVNLALNRLTFNSTNPTLKIYSGGVLAVAYWADTSCSSCALSVQKDGYIAAETTNVGLSNITTSPISQIVLSMGNYSAVSDSITADMNIKGLVAITSDNPVPSVTSISPDSKTAGDAQFTMTINGTNFIASSEVNIDGSARTTTFVSSTQLTATILASDLVSVKTSAVTVSNPTPGGGISNSKNLSITVASSASIPVSVPAAYGTISIPYFSVTVGNAVANNYGISNQIFTINSNKIMIEELKKRLDILIKQLAAILDDMKLKEQEIPKDAEQFLSRANYITNRLSEIKLPLSKNKQGTVLLQNFLISQSKGPASKKLAFYGATGYFGQVTKNALMEWQILVGIPGANGAFGPVTMAYLKSLGY